MPLDYQQIADDETQDYWDKQAEKKGIDEMDGCFGFVPHKPEDKIVSSLRNDIAELRNEITEQQEYLIQASKLLSGNDPDGSGLYGFPFYQVGEKEVLSFLKKMEELGIFRPINK
jgi:hypothetical protein